MDTPVAQVNAGKAAIFDLDGTLLDSLGVWKQVDEIFLAKRGFAVPDDYMQTIAALQFHEVAAYTIERFHLDDTPEALMAEWDELAAYQYAHEVGTKHGAREYLMQLKRTGAKLAVATTLSPALRQPALEHVGLWNLFDAVVGVETVAHGKSEPDIYLRAAKLVSVPADHCTVFEDILPAIKSANRAGMTTYGVYDPSSAMLWDQIQREATGTIHDFTQAPRVL
ncbi:HAD family hydrolase [Bifidobacterium gallicum]|uniref:Beta-phosphoglucomutase n=1 Tax=Bifidobacterium gallicum DSM 20093 = LMG 11596 TaxID=561180 RepID=D1NTW3_9BIFI|nr:HAD family phosphatase [Bifidobacterium gallicum]EFA23167.1 HAD hydrolase, family IA, variant 3 [Bifidobacterium gallicum DSM 20093 = LMG 11596]KFI58836.1 beta-phosphoglucomutase [Bifidobacterium gallicum DSM 20093 = LMG 11596]